MTISSFTAVYFLHFFATIAVNVPVKNPTDYSVRLKGGSRSGEGVLEVYLEDRWHRVPRDRWDFRGTIIVCKQLGFKKASRTKFCGQSNYLPDDDIPFLERDFLCQGSEKDLGSCDYKRIKYWEVHIYCRPGQEVWISCSEQRELSITQPNPSEASGKVNQLPVRLVNNKLHETAITSKGVLEIFYDGQWSRVCADGWHEMDSYVACGQLGYPGAEENTDVGNLFPNPSERYAMTNVNCTGLESSLLSCNHAGFGVHQCNGKLPAFLSCTKSRDEFGNIFGDLNHRIGKVRLRGGERFSEGRVEVFFNEQWGTVCDDNWDLKDGNILCRQLGFGTATFVSHWAEYGQGTNTIMMSDVSCSGTESDIRTCVHANGTNSKCGHEEDAGVRCNYPKPTVQNVRLTGSKSPFEGRVEVRYKNRWYAVCGVWFQKTEGAVVCRELGLGFVGDVFPTSRYGITKIGLYKIHCTGKENSLLDCQHSKWFKRDLCRFYDMASVRCVHALPDLVLDVGALQPSIKIASHPLTHLLCSRSENCLSSSAYTQHAFYMPSTKTRRLLVFTSKILNKGTTSFKPNVHRDRWEWHSCHKHFHSMERFSDYDLIDFFGRKIAEGHKASFCLEDTECDTGVKKMFNCTNKGEQGISVGCADTYKNTLDCQWIDVTDVKEGNYSLLIHLNPSRLVAESDYENNEAACEIHYHDGAVDVGRCSAEPCTTRSYGGTGYGMCCHFPFVYENTTYYSCTTDGFGKPWCGNTANYDNDQRWGYCKEQT